MPAPVHEGPIRTTKVHFYPPAEFFFEASGETGEVERPSSDQELEKLESSF